MGFVGLKGPEVGKVGFECHAQSFGFVCRRFLERGTSSACFRKGERWGCGQGEGWGKRRWIHGRSYTGSAESSCVSWGASAFLQWCLCSCHSSLHECLLLHLERTAQRLPHPDRSQLRLHFLFCILLAPSSWHFSYSVGQNMHLSLLKYFNLLEGKECFIDTGILVYGRVGNRNSGVLLSQHLLPDLS